MRETVEGGRRMINLFLELEDEEQLETLSFVLFTGFNTVESILDDEEAKKNLRHLRNLTAENLNKNKAYLFEERNKNDL